ncbi:hypothetical protein CEXT_372011 [Caerostris extrusa]|uniref:Uncharacterized protein n=1 Tax=Caerostris extrusa TaxID=172846 RepID=A0AAV4PFZ4_CAEEX|nr:hypothetical protein CEXT_372011 [Caerostris extrusa]
MKPLQKSGSVNRCGIVNYPNVIHKPLIAPNSTHLYKVASQETTTLQQKIAKEWRPQSNISTFRDHQRKEGKIAEIP